MNTVHLVFGLWSAAMVVWCLWFGRWCYRNYDRTGNALTLWNGRLQMLAMMPLWVGLAIWHFLSV